jgi:hypothetical protein
VWNWFHNGETCHSTSDNKIDFAFLKTGVFASGVGIDEEHTEGGFDGEVVMLKSLGIPTPRSPHYHVLGPSFICLSPQVSLATEYLASCKYSIECHFHTVSLEEHQQSSTHNSREYLLAVTFI